jgi:hypothetical protein
VCLYRNLLFVFGGTGFPFGHNDLFILDLKRRHWKQCQLLNQKPGPVYGAVRFYLIYYENPILFLIRV